MYYILISLKKKTTKKIEKKPTEKIVKKPTIKKSNKKKNEASEFKSPAFLFLSKLLLLFPASVF